MANIIVNNARRIGLNVRADNIPPGDENYSVMDSYTLHFQELSHLQTSKLIFAKQPYSSGQKYIIQNVVYPEVL